MCQLIFGLFCPLAFLTLQGGTATLSQNITKELPFYAAWYLRRA